MAPFYFHPGGKEGEPVKIDTSWKQTSSKPAIQSLTPQVEAGEGPFSYLIVKPKLTAPSTAEVTGIIKKKEEENPANRTPISRGIIFQQDENTLTEIFYQEKPDAEKQPIGTISWRIE